ncbi:hypothetical protein MRB53_040289 [Persea americana]|nr:hypothetical protein MRB53_040289 [Persea americana]
MSSFLLQRRFIELSMRRASCDDLPRLQMTSATSVQICDHAPSHLDRLRIGRTPHLAMSEADVSDGASVQSSKERIVFQVVPRAIKVTLDVEPTFDSGCVICRRRRVPTVTEEGPDSCLVQRSGLSFGLVRGMQVMHDEWANGGSGYKESLRPGTQDQVPQKWLELRTTTQPHDDCSQQYSVAHGPTNVTPPLWSLHQLFAPATSAASFACKSCFHTSDLFNLHTDSEHPSR